MLCILLLLCLLFSGCSALYDGSYSAVKPHTQQGYWMEQDIIKVDTYLELREAIVTMIASGVETVILSVEAFKDDEIAAQVDKAVSYILRREPVANYAVNRINYEVGTVAGVQTVALKIMYRHGAAELSRIKKASTMQNVESMLYSALDQCETTLVVKVTNFRTTDYQKLLENYALLHPEKVIEQPDMIVTEYPETGTSRLIEFHFDYQSSREILLYMQDYVRPVFSAANLYVRGEEENSVKYALLFSFLMERNEPRKEISITPSYSLLRHGVGDSKAFATVYAAMCQQAGLDCYTVIGTKNGEPWFWNIVNCEDGYYHVDLLQAHFSGGFITYTDDQMQGYVWDYSAYPACVDQSAEDAGTTDKPVPEIAPQQ